MSIFMKNEKGRISYTREADEKLIELVNQGVMRSKIAKVIGHPENSLQFRIRFLKKKEEEATEKGVEITCAKDLLDTIDYR